MRTPPTSVRRGGSKHAHSARTFSTKSMMSVGLEARLPSSRVRHADVVNANAFFNVLCDVLIFGMFLFAVLVTKC
jgi:hypothetical protein